MSKMQEIRERAHNRAERWEHRLEALEAQLESTGEQAMKRVADTAGALVDAAEALEKKLEPAADELRHSLEEMRVQMALGKAESRDAFDAESNKVHKQLHAAEHLVDQLGDELEARAGKEAERFVRMGDRLRSELEAAELQYSLGHAQAQDAVAEGRSELRDLVAAARGELKEAGEEAGERWQAFEDRMGAALSDLRAAFRALGGR
jgi:ElaB/YqjD/DUF883 family membrane-anchored ribosome-binding protein